MLDKVSENQVTVVGENPIAGPDESPSYDFPRYEQTPRGPTAGAFFLRGFLVIFQAILMIAILAGSYFLAKRMIDNKPERKKRPRFATIYTVETVKPTLKDHRPIFTSYGQTTAARSVELRSLVSGEIIKVSNKLRDGAQVEKGDALVSIDDFTFKGALSEANANLAEAKARIMENEAQISLENGRLESAREQLEFAETDLARAEKLKSRGTSTQQQVETRKLTVSQRKQALVLYRDTINVQKARLEQLKASITRLNWGVEKAQRNLDSTTLVAPFAGIVRTSTAEVGRAITANDVVVSMYEVGTLETKFTLTDAQYGRLQTSDEGLIGKIVTVKWTVGGKQYSYPATVDRVGADISSNRGGVEVIANLQKADRSVTLRPGAFVEVSVPDIVFKGTYSIPDTAIYENNIVYAVVDGALKAKTISIAAFEGDQALINDGLNAGDEILITRITEVSNGLKVQTEAQAAEKSKQRRAQNAETKKPAQSDNGAPTGRPTREEMQALFKAAKITRADFMKLSRSEKQAFVKKWRSAKSNSSN